MTEANSFVIRMEEVRDRLEQGEKVMLADCRFQLGQPASGREAYLRGHLPGAVYWDLEEDLSGPVTGPGGRHPMPDLGKLLLKLGERGIDNGTTVIAYDDQGGAMASRFWWLLRFLGASKVYVMDGGYTAWEQAGYPVTTAIPEKPVPKVFGSRVKNSLLVVMEDVKEKLGNPGVVLIDSREHKRYLGEEEPIDKAAGHIPGAVNRFWKDVLGPDGRWKSAEELKERFADIPADSEVIVYCGSGVTACPNVLALAVAGRPDAKLYLGSWSDWISNGDNPIAVGEEEAN